MLKHSSKVTYSIKLTGILLMLTALTGCYSKYYLKKKVDIFQPNVNDKFTIYHNTSVLYYSSIFNKLVSELNKIPIKYSSSPYVSYSVYFNNKRFFLLPVFRVTIIKQNNTLKLPDEIVYDSLVYSYGFNIKKSLIASLKIISSDIVNKEYKKSKFIKVSSADINEFQKQKVQKVNFKKGGEIKSYKNTSRKYQQYKLYSKLKAYK